MWSLLHLGFEQVVNATISFVGRVRGVALGQKPPVLAREDGQLVEALLSTEHVVEKSPELALDSRQGARLEHVLAVTPNHGAGVVWNDHGPFGVAPRGAEVAEGRNALDRDPGNGLVPLTHVSGHVRTAL